MINQRILMMALVWCLALPFNVVAQNFNSMQYGYDDAGNRISRTLVITYNKTMPNDQDSVPLTDTVSIAHDSIQLDPLQSTTAKSELIPNVYPNPTTDFVVVDLLYNSQSLKPVSTTVFVYDSKQSLVHTFQTVSSRVEVDMSNLAAGLYKLIVQSTENSHFFTIYKK